MKLTARESMIGLVTGVIAFIGLVFILGNPLLVEVQAQKDAQRKAKKDLVLFQKRASKLPATKEAYGALQVSLPRYPADQRVTSILYQILDNLVEKHDVNLTRRTVGKESQEGELFETPLTCDWDATLDSLVSFLGELQTMGVMLDVKLLEVKPVKGGRLKGKFTINYVYHRDQT